MLITSVHNNIATNRMPYIWLGHIIFYLEMDITCGKNQNLADYGWSFENIGEMADEGKESSWEISFQINGSTMYTLSLVNVKAWLIMVDFCDFWFFKNQP